MTDSVTKNLKVENYVAQKLGSHRVPHHLLCKAHVLEKFDETNLKVLSNITIQLQLCERLKLITHEEWQHMPTNNVTCERLLVTFSHHTEATSNMQNMGRPMHNTK